MIEKWKTSSDKKGFAGAVLMDLSKAFDCLNHNLLIAKLFAYGFDRKSLYLIWDYLNNRWQRVKIDSSFSTWYELTVGVPQGSVLGPLLFNVYLNDLFFTNDSTEVCNFADDTSLYSCNKNLEIVLNSLEKDSNMAIKWFKNNFMKINPDKFHLLVSGNSKEPVSIQIGGEYIQESKEELLLGITIDNQLKFKHQIDKNCKQAGGKLTAIIRECHSISFDKLKPLLLSFVESQFNYCPLVLMFCTRTEKSVLIKFRNSLSEYYTGISLNHLKTF